MTVLCDETTAVNCAEQDSAPATNVKGRVDEGTEARFQWLGDGLMCVYLAETMGARIVGRLHALTCIHNSVPGRFKYFQVASRPYPYPFLCSIAVQSSVIHPACESNEHMSSFLDHRSFSRLRLERFVPHRCTPHIHSTDLELDRCFGWTRSPRESSQIKTCYGFESTIVCGEEGKEVGGIGVSKSVLPTVLVRVQLFVCEAQMQSSLQL